MQTSNKPRIVIVAGGTSAEREVSLAGGRAVALGLEARGLETVWLDPAEGSIETFDWRGGDVAFLVLHGEFGEDGQVQSLLDERGSYSRCCHPMKPTTRNSLVRQSLPRRSLPYMILTDDNSSFGLHTAP